jgi:hypothetical protein
MFVLRPDLEGREGKSFRCLRDEPVTDKTAGLNFSSVPLETCTDERQRRSLHQR